MIKEKCGLLAFYGNSQISILQFVKRLNKLQHRGRDGVGITYIENGLYNTFKSKGTILEVFFENPSDEVKKLLEKKSNMILGHLRYATSNTENELFQPLVENNLAVAHNGNIPDKMLLNIIEKLGIKKENKENLHDTEVYFDYLKNSEEKFKKKISETLEYFNGSFNFIIMKNKNMYIVRDKNGFRPLSYSIDQYDNILISSETVAYDYCNEKNHFKYINDISKNTVLKIDIINQSFDILNNNEPEYKNSNCVFEYIYFMNPKSEVRDNNKNHITVEVEEYRYNLGVELAKQEKYNFFKYKPKDIIVVGSPNTAIPGAIAYAKELKLPYSQVLKKKPNTGRTFILPNDNAREKYFKKFELDKEKIKDKIIIFIDDSIVRGNTIKSVCYFFKENGAKELHMRVLSPPISNPCYYGIHIPTKEELLINRKNISQIEKELNLNSLSYLDLESLDNIFGKNICKGCFDGKYDPDILF
jgi:amidophosphoribosyltransferase